MKNRNTLFNANRLALMHGLSINPIPARAEVDRHLTHQQENPRRNSHRRSQWRLWLLPLVAKIF